MNEEKEQDNRQRFNDLLNSSKDPWAMYNALLALAPLIKEVLAREDQT